MQHDLSLGFARKTQDSLAPENRQGSRYRFMGKTEIIGNIATAHRQHQQFRRFQATVHFGQEERNPLLSGLPAEKQNMVFCVLKISGHQFQERPRPEGCSPWEIRKTLARVWRSGRGY